MKDYLESVFGNGLYTIEAVEASEGGASGGIGSRDGRGSHGIIHSRPGQDVSGSYWIFIYYFFYLFCA